jgi:Carboxypeptidase regulatory-like domain/TonB-dependent Receptor Plug Domain
MFTFGGPSNMRTLTQSAPAFKRQIQSTARWLPVALRLWLVVSMGWATTQLTAQTAGDGAIQGTVTDSTGAVIAGAKVVATNNATHVSTAQPTTSEGFYDLRPLIPGTYTVTISAPGFKSVTQESVLVNAMQVVGLNERLQLGNAAETVTVTAAPPALDTTGAVLGSTMTTAAYTDLPVMLSLVGASALQQRDITQVSNLMPGAQVPPGGRSSIVGGTAQRLGEVYIDGMPTTDISQQGDNRPVFNVIPLEAINQVQVITSGFPAEYQGAGMENYSLASGGNHYHGALFEYDRNTEFDAWSFSAKPGGPNVTEKVVNGALSSVPGPKTPEHQNEYGFKVGGPISIPHLFNGRDRLFFFAAYDGFRSYEGVNFSATTVPTEPMRSGDFSQLLAANGGPGYNIYDPTTLTCPTPTTCTRQQYQYNGQLNVIPPGELSPITQAMMKWLPAPQTDAITNNLLTGIPQGYHNWLYSGRFDWDISQNHRLSGAVAGGNRHAVPYTATSTPGVPVLPYIDTSISTVAGHYADLEDTYTFSPHLVNQVKYGFLNFGGPPVTNPTEGVSDYGGASFGITGLPTGQASADFPSSTFSGSNEPVGWGAAGSYTTVSNTYEVVDNFSWIKGRHAMTFGLQYQWLEDQSDSYDGYSHTLSIGWSTNETAQISGSSYASGTGYSFASFMIGAVNSSGLTVQPFAVTGGRYRTIAPYFEDDLKVNSKLTLNLGLRWDWLPTYTEVLNRWSFLNPNLTNPITANPGALQFAGNYGGTPVSCLCSSPVNNDWKNWGPRLGFAYSVNHKTVVRGGYSILYTHAGGVGGATGAGTGTGNNGFTSTVSFPDNPAGPNAGPAFWLNTVASSAWSSAVSNGSSNTYSGGYTANTNIGGPGYVLPAIASPSAISQGLLTGYFVCGASNAQYPQCHGVASGGSGGSGSSIAFADPYLGGRAPQTEFWNFGIERELRPDLTINLNYAGSESHFLAGASNIRGLQSGELNPTWYALGTYLAQPATPTNIAAAEAATGVTLPNYPWYQAAAAVNPNATIAHMLLWMPQYSGTSDTWGDVANANYHAFQLSLTKRTAHGSSFTVNYTFSKNLDDAGTARSGYAIPASVTLNGKAWTQDRIDYSRSVDDQPQNLEIFGVYALPFGKGGYGANHALVRTLAGGWKLSGISQYWAGLPLGITASCAGYEGYDQGTCMPDENPNVSGAVRINGGWGSGATAATLGSRPFLAGYINKTGTVASNGTGPGYGAGGVTCLSSTGPFCNPGGFMVGDAARNAPYGLRGPGEYRLNLALRRSFPIADKAQFIFGADCANVTNSVLFGNNAQNNEIGTNVNSSSFGTVGFASADSRAFQFSGRLEF